MPVQRITIDKLLDTLEKSFTKEDVMKPIDVAQHYFDAWNQRDPLAIVATFADSGTYRDPTVPQGEL